MEVKNPLVTMTVICYKAENYIKEAIAGVLAQDYHPLEIVFSDDASPDRTFEIIKEELVNYSGPHKIVLNRNEHNMGIGAHVFKIWLELASGEWLVSAAGDDVSLPHRVSYLMQYASDDVAAMHHNCIKINNASEETGFFDIPDQNILDFEIGDYNQAVYKKLWLSGAAMVLNRKLLLKYGKFNPGVVTDDNILAYRALHFGKVLHFKEPLMKYRKHEGGITHREPDWTAENYSAYKVKMAKWLNGYYQQVITDSKLIPFEKWLLDFVKTQIKRNNIDIAIFSKPGFSNSFRGFNFNQLKYWVKSALTALFLPIHIKRLNAQKNK